ncbi:hypothetical protein SK128_006912, partial [Halocaridina rubra]
ETEENNRCYERKRGTRCGLGGGHPYGQRTNTVGGKTAALRQPCPQAHRSHIGLATLSPTCFPVTC